MWKDCNYLLLDAARMGPEILVAREKNPGHLSLYRGESEVRLSRVAPYLFPFNASTPFGKWYLENGWGQSWGIPFRASADILELQKHFRQFLKVQTEFGKELIFRFYDPRVLRIFLPTCDPWQLKEFFGPVQFFLIEDEEAGFLKKQSVVNGALKIERFPIEPIIPSKSKEEDVAVAGELPAQPAVPPVPPNQPPPKPQSRWNIFD